MGPGTIRHPKHRCRQYLAGLALLCLAPGAFAAPGFVAGSKVTRGNTTAEISIQFACRVEYVDHLPANRGDRLHIQLESTTICTGVSPTVAQSRQQYRPLGADKAKLLEIGYNGGTAGGQRLTLAFSEVVRFEVVHSGVSNNMIVRVFLNQPGTTTPSKSATTSVRVQRSPAPAPEYVINLSSSRNSHAPSDMPTVELLPGLRIYESEVVLAGVTWYRLRLGHFKKITEAQVQLTKLRDHFPTAWIDRATDTVVTAIGSRAKDGGAVSTAIEPSIALASIGLDKIDQLMDDARQAMVADKISQAVQIYTKVLRIAEHDRRAEAQEYLALAREKNGQKAHAKAEYQRYLSLYPDSEGASRVNQRLAALLATDRQSRKPGNTARATKRSGPKPGQSDWRVHTFFSQYYRRDANQFNEEDEVVGQSALYSDISLDARRRGKRFDFGSRLSAGYRNDFLGEDEGSGNELRVSYAYADLADAETRLRGRFGRQSRNKGGILGRFDGLNLGYQASERILINAVVGQPVNSASDGLDSEKTFFGASANYGPIFENLEVGIFYVQQDIKGIEDRQAVGTEFRYFGENQSLWGLIDYDSSYSEVSSAFLQGSWRFASRLTLHGSIDRRHSPYLSTSNALIGQPVETFSELLVLLTEEEIRQLSLDRAPLMASTTFGLSHSLSPRLQINADANHTTVEATPASGGVAATPETTYRYLSTSLVASSLLTEGDVSMIGLRMSDSDTTKVISLNLDSRFPIGRTWRINPRLRIDRRQIMSDSSHEWLYTTGIRIQFRRSRKYRIEFEAGKQFSQREMADADLDRESYFINAGYQAFF